MAVERSAVKKAIKKRRSYVLSNLSTLTMKQFRKLLEEDMGLPEKALHEHKDFVSQCVDSIVKASQEAQEADAAGKPESAKPAKPAKAAKASKAVEEPKKAKKREREEPEPKKAAAGDHSKRFAKMKAVAKQAGLTIPPSTYARKSPTQQEAALEAFLEKHGLSHDSSPAEIAAAKKRRAEEKDLEGIDTSNILEGGRRTRARVDYSAVARKAYAELSGSETSEEEEDEDDGSGSEADSDAGSGDGGGSDAENVRPGNGSGQRAAQEADRKKAAGSPQSDAEVAPPPASVGKAKKGKSPAVARAPDQPGKAAKTPGSGSRPKAAKSPGSSKRAKVAGSPGSSEKPARRRAAIDWSDEE